MANAFLVNFIFSQNTMAHEALREHFETSFGSEHLVCCTIKGYLDPFNPNAKQAQKTTNIATPPFGLDEEDWSVFTYEFEGRASFENAVRQIDTLEEVPKGKKITVKNAMAAALYVGMEATYEY